MELPPVTRSSSDVMPKGPTTFRASCDNCAQSKVRCGKEQPQCQRCSNQGVCCVYSPSQRVRNRRPSFNSGRQQEQAPPPAHLAPQLDGPSTLPPQSEADTAFAATLSAQLRRTNPIELPETAGTPETHHGSFTPFHFFDADLDTLMKWGDPLSPPPLDPARQGASMLTEYPPMPQWLHTDPVGSDYVEDDDTRNDSSILDDEMIESFIDKPSAGSSSALKSQGSQIGSQHCPKLALSTLQSLDLSMASCSSVTPNLDPSSSNGATRSLDTVLRVNQAAIDNVLKILECPCTANTNLALIVTIIVLKILSWYQASLERSSTGDDGSSTASAGSSSHFSSACGSRGRSPSPAAESVFMPPITIGAYQLEAEHRSRMIAQLMLTELAKMSRIVDGFSRKYCQDEPMSTEDSQSQLHFALHMFVKCRLKMTVLAAKRQLTKN